MLEVKGVSKQYANGVHALRDVSLTLGRGVFGLLGPNGAGKSSLMRTLATLQRPDCGRIMLGGLDLLADPMQARHRIGYLPQDMGVYPRVSALEMLDYLAGLRGLPRRTRKAEVQSLLDRVNLADVAHRRLDTYSGGMRRRFGIAAAFLGAPDLVIVDEPTAGLDPSERRRFQLLLADAAQRCVLILSSHIVEDLEGLCTDMAVLDKGQIVKAGSPSTLVSDLQGKIWQRSVPIAGFQELHAHHDVLSWRPHHGEMVVRVRSDTRPGPHFEPTLADLEDLYAASTGGQSA